MHFSKFQHFRLVSQPQLCMVIGHVTRSFRMNLMLLTYLDSHYKPDTRVLGIFVLKIGRNKLYNWQCGRDTWKTISWLTKQTRYSCSRNFDSTSEGFLKIERRKLFDWQFGKSKFLQDNILAQNTNQILLFPKLWQH